MNIRHIVRGIVAGVLLCTSQAAAQSAAPQPSAENWQVQVVPYLWGSGLKGPVGIGNRTVELDASFSDIFSALHFAAMGFVDARRDRLVVLTDVIYTDLREQHATPGPLFSGVDPQQRLFILTPEAGYRVLDSEDMALDVVGGIRYWYPQSELRFRPGVLPGINLAESRGWVDGIVGLRARRALSRKWWVNGYWDLGAGGSKFTYQIFGRVNVDIHERYALNFGYRYLSVDYDNNNFLFDIAMKGPLFGFTIKL